MAVNSVQGGNPAEPIHGLDSGASGAVIQSGALVEPGTDSPVRVHHDRGLTVDLSCIATSMGRTLPPGGWSGGAFPLNGGASVICKWVKVQALRGNSTVVEIGNSFVDAATLTENGVALFPGDSEDVPVGNVNFLYVDALASTDGVTWWAFA